MPSVDPIKYLVIWTTIVLGFFTVSSLSAPTMTTSSPSCVQITWQYIIVFYGVNYLAHAGTVPTPAGARWDFALQWALASLFLPYVGLGRSFALIYRSFTWRNNELKQASASNALVVLARSKEWESDPDEEKMHEGFWKADDRYAHAPGARIIYGKMTLPPGKESQYRWIMASPDILNNIKSVTWDDFGNFHFSKSQSWLTMALSVAQLIYSCISIYRSRGNQIDHFGYAAFGLSVFPYAVMSAANFLCAAWVGQYPCVYALTSPVMDDATTRGGTFIGAIPVQWSDNFQTSTATRKPISSSGNEARAANGEVARTSSMAMSGPNSRESESLSVLWSLAIILVSGLAMLAVQCGFLYGLSRFRKGQSTVAQRAWMMAWIGANQLAFFPFACISVLWPEYLNNTKNRLILFIIMSPLGVAAVGGFIEVGLMMGYIAQTQMC